MKLLLLRKMVLCSSLLLTSALFSVIAQATTTEARSERGAEVIRSLNQGEGQPKLETMREESPFLAEATEATEAYALGDVWSRPGLDDRTRQLAAVSAMAAWGEVYMITVPAGFPRAIAASQVLSDLFSERDE